MAEAIGNFSSANPTESELFTFNFVNDLGAGDSIDTGQAAVWTCTVLEGEDSAAQSRITDVGFSGTKSTARGAGFLADVVYCLASTIKTTLGDTLTLWAQLPGKPIGC